MVAHYEKVTYNKWVEPNYERERIARNMTNILLQEMMSNALGKILKGSEGSLVEVVSRLMDAVMWDLPVEYDVEVTRGECQSVANKDHKSQQNSELKGNRPDLIIQAYLRNKWDEVAYIESSKWQTSDQKIFDDHNKLVKLTLDGFQYLLKKYVKDVLHDNFIGFGISIAGEYFVLHGLIRKNEVNFYLPVFRAKIPFSEETIDEIEDFIHTLLILQVSIIFFIKC